MVPVSEINDARRRAVEELEKARLAHYSRPPLPLKRYTVQISFRRNPKRVLYLYST